jgi:hypothetical protein
VPFARALRFPPREASACFTFDLEILSRLYIGSIIERGPGGCLVCLGRGGEVAERAASEVFWPLVAVCDGE